MEKTVFDNIDIEMYNTFLKYGYYYESYSYMNVFRWLWNEKGIHPDICSFPGASGTHSTKVSFNNLSKGKSDTFFIKNYDDAIIHSVDYIYNNINNYLNK